MTEQDRSFEEAFGESRLGQIARLAAILREQGGRLRPAERTIAIRALGAMVEDCAHVGIDKARVTAALNGRGPARIV